MQKCHSIYFHQACSQVIRNPTKEQQYLGTAKQARGKPNEKAQHISVNGS